MSIQCLPHPESEDRSAELTFNSVVKVCLLFPMEDVTFFHLEVIPTSRKCFRLASEAKEKWNLLEKTKRGKKNGFFFWKGILITFFVAKTHPRFNALLCWEWNVKMSHTVKLRCKNQLKFRRWKEWSRFLWRKYIAQLYVRNESVKLNSTCNCKK